MSGAGDPLAPSGGGAPDPRSDGGSRSDRRTVRKHQGRRRQNSRLLAVGAPALALLAVVAVLFPLLVSPGGQEPSAPTTSVASGGASDTTSPPTTSHGGTVQSGPSAGDPAIAPGGAVLVVQSDGAPAALALVYGGPGGGVVVGVPGTTVLRAGDRFVRVAALCAPDRRGDLADCLSGALSVPVKAVASISWSDLRDGLSAAGIEGGLPADMPGPADGGAAAPATFVAEALAVALGKAEIDVDRGETRAAGADGVLWASLTGGDPDGFRAAIAAALQAAAAAGWTGQAVAGSLIEGSGAGYLEPDVTGLDSARKALAAAGMGT
jgi:hypothetical protein